VGCCAINSTPGGGDVPLTGGGEEPSGELLLPSPMAFDGWHGGELGVYPRIPLGNL